MLLDLFRQTHPLKEILVVDNGSRDASVEIAQQLGARVIPMGCNAGFCRAVNRGIEASTGDWVAVVNNDVRLQPDWLERLLDCAQAAGAWFATGKMFQAGRPGRLDGAFDALSRAACPWRCGHGRQDGPLWSAPQTISFAPLTAAILKRDLFTRVGLLDEDFESYLDDVDLGLRCAAAGLHGQYVPDAVATHQGSATLGEWHPRKVRLLARNQLLLVAKHYPPNWLLRYGWPVLVGQLLWGIVALRHGAGWAWLRGKIEALRLFGVIRGKAPRTPKVAAILAASEGQLHRIQQQTGPDWYWRLYFALT